VSSGSLLISAGEASGEHYGAGLMAALRALGNDLEFFGVGGEQMRHAGFEAVVDANRIAVVGLFEVVRHLPMIRREFHRLLQEVDRRRPKAAVLIDFPDFNLRLAGELHARGIPVIYFVSPQLWAWRRGRIRQVQRYVRKMLVIFPFEEPFYRRHNVDATYVGHPLAVVPAPESLDSYAARFGLDRRKPWIALLPGSRKQEVLRHLPVMLEAVRDFGDGHYELLLPVASTLDQRWLQQQLSIHSGVHSFEIKVVQDARPALVHSRAAVVASGTATVEAALAGVPFVVVYKVAPLTYALGARLVKVNHYAMPNLIAGRKVVEELIQHQCTPEKIREELTQLLSEGPRRKQMLSDLAQVQEKLKPPKGLDDPLRAAACEVTRILSAPSG
jgi:lipid-A-disaccharide synthase